MKTFTQDEVAAILNEVATINGNHLKVEEIAMAHGIPNTRRTLVNGESARLTMADAKRAIDMLYDSGMCNTPWEDYAFGNDWTVACLSYSCHKMWITNTNTTHCDIFMRRLAATVAAFNPEWALAQGIVEAGASPVGNPTEPS